jgi:transposase
MDSQPYMALGATTMNENRGGRTETWSSLIGAASPSRNLTRAPWCTTDCCPRARMSSYLTGRASPCDLSPIMEVAMEVVYERCCGLDVHKKTVVACRVTPGPDGQPQKVTRTFETMTDQLLALSRWLSEGRVSHVVMESTGVYWQPIWNLLEDDFHLILANPRQVKARKRRKTDVIDAEWLADLLRHDLVDPSFVPTREQRELRELTRYRVSLVQERSSEVNRLQKTLEGANIKLASVVSNIDGFSARQMLHGLIEGTVDTHALAQLAIGRMRSKIPDLQRALEGRFTPHQRFLVARQLARIDGLDTDIEAVTAEIEARMQAEKDTIERLDTIPGVGQVSACAILAEIGTDMSQFGRPENLSSWTKMAPGLNESAGKRHSGSTGKGNRWIRRILVQCAHAASHGKSYLASQYSRVAARRGKKRAAVAVGHSILVIIFQLLSNPGLTYHDLGFNYFDERRKSRLTQRLVQRIQGLGFYVTLEPTA